MDATQLAATITMVAAVSGATYTDIRYSKIFNALTLPTALIGIAINGVGHGAAGVLFSLEGIAIGLALLPVCGLLGRILGGGDIKLLAAVGALQGPHFLLWALAYTAITGGVLALIIALWRRSLSSGFRRLWGALLARFIAQQPMDIANVEHNARLPYAVAIALGSFIAVYFVQFQ